MHGCGHAFPTEERIARRAVGVFGQHSVAEAQSVSAEASLTVRHNLCLPNSFTTQARISSVGRCLTSFLFCGSDLATQACAIERVVAATTSFPWLGKILNISSSARSLISKAGNLSLSCAEVFGRVAYIPGAALRFAKTGATTIVRARTFVSRLVLALQTTALGALLSAMHKFRQGCADTVEAGGACATVLVFRHSWDETKQLLRDAPKTAQARQPKYKVAKNVLVQRSMVYASASVTTPEGRTSHYNRCEYSYRPQVLATPFAP